MGGMGVFDMELMPQAMQILMEAGGELTNEVKDALLELGLSEEQIESLVDMQNGFPGMGGFGGFPDRRVKAASRRWSKEHTWRKRG
jgi:hypothetical protein